MVQPSRAWRCRLSVAQSCCTCGRVPGSGGRPGHGPGDVDRDAAPRAATPSSTAERSQLRARPQGATRVRRITAHRQTAPRRDPAEGLGSAAGRARWRALVTSGAWVTERRTTAYVADDGRKLRRSSRPLAAHERVHVFVVMTSPWLALGARCGIDPACRLRALRGSALARARRGEMVPRRCPTGGIALHAPSDDSGFRIEFFPTQTPKIGPNQIAPPPDEHIPRRPAVDSGSGAPARGAAPPRRRSTPPRESARGARRPRGQRVLRDRADGNTFLADCGFLGRAGL